MRYPNHRSTPWLTEDAPRDRSNRLLNANVRSFTVMITITASIGNRDDPPKITIERFARVRSMRPRRMQPTATRNAISSTNDINMMIMERSAIRGDRGGSKPENKMATQTVTTPAGTNTQDRSAKSPPRVI
jgi:hypothetical protein